MARIRAVEDPVERARLAQEFIVNGMRTLDAMRQVRDEGIREARLGRRGTVDELAAEVRVKRNVVVDACRHLGREE